jgi:hypothetical protein
MTSKRKADEDIPDSSSSSSAAASTTPKKDDPGDSSVTSGTDATRRRSRKRARRIPHPSPDEQKKEFEGRSAKATAAAEAEHTIREERETPIDAVLRKSGTAAVLKRGSLDELKATQPHLFNKSTPSQTPPETKQIPEKDEMRPQAIVDLIEEIRKCPRIEVVSPADAPLSLPPFSSAVLNATPSSSSSSAAAAQNGTKTVINGHHSTIENETKRRALAINGAIDIPLHSTKHIQNLSEEGGIWHSTVGTQYSFPTCDSKEKCVINTYRNTALRVRGAVDRAPPFEMKAYLTEDEHTRCEKGESMQIKRPCVWCMVWRLDNINRRFKTPYTSELDKHSPVPIALDAAIQLQAFYVKCNQPDGFISIYTSNFLPQHSASSPSPYLKLDFSALYAETITGVAVEADKTPRRRLNIDAMIYRDPLQLKQPIIGSAAYEKRQQLNASRQAMIERASAAALAAVAKKSANFKKANKAPKQAAGASSGSTSLALRLQTASVMEVLGEYTGQLKSHPTSAKKGSKSKRSDAETIKRACNEHFLRASNPQLLRTSHEEARHVETLFATIDSLRTSLSQLPRAKKESLAASEQTHLGEVAAFLVDPLFRQILTRLVSVDERYKWTPKHPTPDGGIEDPKTDETAFLRNTSAARFTHLDSHTVRKCVSDAIIDYCEETRRIFLSSPSFLYTFIGALQECEETTTRKPTEARKWMEFLCDPTRVPSRLFLGILRVTLLMRLADLLRKTRTLLTPDKLDWTGELQVSMQRVNYPLHCVMDTYWFVPYSIISRVGTDPIPSYCSACEDLIDCHYDNASTINESTLYAFQECVEHSYYISDSIGKKFPFVHFFQKTRPKRSQARMMASVIRQYTNSDTRFRKFMCQLAASSLLGTYRHLPGTHSLRFPLRAFVYEKLYWANAGREWLFFAQLFSDDLDRFMMQAGQQYMFMVCRNCPAFGDYCRSIYPMDTLSAGTDKIIQSLRLQLSEEQVRVRSSDEKFEILAELYRASNFKTESTKLCLSSPYSKRCTGFLLAIPSFYKKVKPVHEKSKKNGIVQAATETVAAATSDVVVEDDEDDDDGSDDEGSDDDDHHDDETRTKEEEFEEKLHREAAKMAGVDMSDHVKSDSQVARADSKELLRYPSVESFGLRLEEVVAIWQVVSAINNKDQFPERYLFRLLQLMGSSSTTHAELLDIATRFESGKKVAPRMVKFAETYPRSSVVVHTFAILFKRHCALKAFPLPAYYIVNQITAIRKRYNLKPDSDYIPDYSCQILVCPVCLSLKNSIRDPPGKSHFLGKDGGYVNVCVDLDPLQDTVRSYCNGTESFAGIKCTNTELVSVPALGFGFLYRNDYIAYCPHCGVLSVINPYQTVTTEYGFACSDCSICLIGYSLERHARGLPGITDTENDVASSFQPTDDNDTPRVSNRKTPKHICDVCNEYVSRRVTRCTVLGIEIVACNKHKVKHAERSADRIELKQVVAPSCVSSCVCDDLRSTCDGKWNLSSVMKLIRTNDLDAGVKRSAVKILNDKRRYSKTKKK